MQYTDNQHHLQVNFRTLECRVPGEELARMEQRLDELGASLRKVPDARLTVTLVHHPRSQVYHVECRLQLPGKTLFSSDYGADYREAFDRCTRKLAVSVGDYLENGRNRAAESTAGNVAALGRDVVAPGGHDTGPVGQAVQEGDYKKFRRLLSGYEEWLRKRVGRWVQRYPEAQAQVGDRLRLGDLLEEVYLNAFERYDAWPTAVPFHEWLDRLIDPSLKEFMRHPAEEAENASLARTLRDMGPR
jgi:ribosome-associated translation inhibitor RaiA